LASSQESHLKSAWPGKCIFFDAALIETKGTLPLLWLMEENREVTLYCYLESSPSEMENVLVLNANVFSQIWEESTSHADLNCWGLQVISLKLGKKVSTVRMAHNLLLKVSFKCMGKICFQSLRSQSKFRSRRLLKLSFGVF